MAVTLTIAMVAARNMLLGYPSAMMWAVFGGGCYLRYLTMWDIYYLTFFASLGMTIFCMLAMYALRKSDLADTDVDKERYFDEEPTSTAAKRENARNGIPENYMREGRSDGEEAARPSRRVRELRARAARRRGGEGETVKKSSWGEFG